MYVASNLLNRHNLLKRPFWIDLFLLQQGSRKTVTNKQKTNAIISIIILTILAYTFMNSICHLYTYIYLILFFLYTLHDVK